MLVADPVIDAATISGSICVPVTRSRIPRTIECSDVIRRGIHRAMTFIQPARRKDRTPARLPIYEGCESIG